VTIYLCDFVFHQDTVSDGAELREVNLDVLLGDGFILQSFKQINHLTFPFVHLSYFHLSYNDNNVILYKDNCIFLSLLIVRPKRNLINDKQIPIAETSIHSFQLTITCKSSVSFIPSLIKIRIQL
jgi:hypothetical protein